MAGWGDLIAILTENFELDQDDDDRELCPDGSPKVSNVNGDLGCIFDGLTDAPARPRRRRYRPDIDDDLVPTVTGADPHEGGWV